jgi:hypothetical protein
MLNLISKVHLFELLLIIGFITFFMGNKHRDINRYTRRTLGGLLFICISPFLAGLLGSVFSQGSFLSSDEGSILWVYRYVIPYANWLLIMVISIRLIFLFRSRDPYAIKIEPEENNN